MHLAQRNELARSTRRTMWSIYRTIQVRNSNHRLLIGRLGRHVTLWLLRAEPRHAAPATARCERETLHIFCEPPAHGWRCTSVSVVDRGQTGALWTAGMEPCSVGRWPSSHVPTHPARCSLLLPCLPCVPEDAMPRAIAQAPLGNMSPCSYRHPRLQHAAHGACTTGGAASRYVQGIRHTCCILHTDTCVLHACVLRACVTCVARGQGRVSLRSICQVRSCRIGQLYACTHASTSAWRKGIRT